MQGYDAKWKFWLTIASFMCIHIMAGVNIDYSWSGGIGGKIFGKSLFKIKYALTLPYIINIALKVPERIECTIQSMCLSK